MNNLLKTITMMLAAVALCSMLTACGNDEPDADLKITLKNSSYEVVPDDMTADYSLRGAVQLPLELSKKATLQVADFEITGEKCSFTAPLDNADGFRDVTTDPTISLAAVYKDVNTGDHSLVVEYKVDEDIPAAEFTFDLVYKGTRFATDVKVRYTRLYTLYTTDEVRAGATSLIQVLGIEDGQVIDASTYTVSYCQYLGDRKVTFSNMTLSVPADFAFTDAEKAAGYAALRLEARLFDRTRQRSVRVYGKFRLHPATEP